ncbi:hypothetical protein EFK07_31830, partial [Pseudomonas putida]
TPPPATVPPRAGAPHRPPPPPPPGGAPPPPPPPKWLLLQNAAQPRAIRPTVIPVAKPPARLRQTITVKKPLSCPPACCCSVHCSWPRRRAWA